MSLQSSLQKRKEEVSDKTKKKKNDVGNMQNTLPVFASSKEASQTDNDL